MKMFSERDRFPLSLTIIALLASGLGAVARADDQCASRVAETFHGAYYARDVYRPARCARNVDVLTQRLADAGVPWEKMRVLYLLYESHIGAAIPIPYQADMTPARPRNGPLKYQWPRHVLLEIEGNILDLDYLPEPIAARDYFRAMFPCSPHHRYGPMEPHLHIRVIPAARHREEFSRQHGDDIAVVRVLGIRQDALAGLPVQTVAAFLDEIAPTH